MTEREREMRRELTRLQAIISSPFASWTQRPSCPFLFSSQHHQIADLKSSLGHENFILKPLDSLSTSEHNFATGREKGISFGAARVRR